MNKLIAIFASIAALTINRQDLHQPLTDTKLSFEKHSSMSQAFTSNYDNLNIISICVRNPERSLLPLQFTLHESTSSAAPARTLTFNGGNIDNQDCTRFQFDPITDSAGKSYVAVIKATKTEKEFSHSGIYVESYGASDYVRGEAYLDNIVNGTDFHFKTSHRENLWGTVNESLMQFRRRLGQDIPFFTFYILVVGLVIYRLWKKRHA